MCEEDLFAVMSKPENILVRGVNWLGDAVMTTPALQRLREAKPSARITLLTTDKLADLWEGQPYLDEVMTFNKDEGVAGISRRLRKKKFTASIAFPNSIRSAMEMWLARIPQRVGLKSSGRSLLLSQAMDLPAGAQMMRKRSDDEIKRLIEDNAKPEVFPTSSHQAHHYLHLVTALGASAKPIAPRIVVSDWAMDSVRGRFGIDAGEDHPWFGLNPGAEYGPAKRWPAENFIEAANDLQRRTGCRWLIFGAKADHELAAAIARGIQTTSAVNLAGKTTLRELVAALKLCRLLISNDTGPTHLAAAVGAPVVVPYGSTSPELTGPFFCANSKIVRFQTPCAPCFLPTCPVDFRCMKKISADMVVEAAMEIYNATKKP